MARLGICHAVVGGLTVLTLFVGLAAIGGSIYIGARGGDATDCERFILKPLIIGGICVVLVSTLGIVGSLGRINVAMYIFLGVTILVILGLVVWTTVYVSLMTNTKVGQKIWKGYKVKGFKQWFQFYVIEDYERWNAVKSCLVAVSVCWNLPVDVGSNNNSLIFGRLSATQVSPWFLLKSIAQKNCLVQCLFLLKIKIIQNQVPNPNSRTHSILFVGLDQKRLK